MSNLSIPDQETGWDGVRDGTGRDGTGMRGTGGNWDTYPGYPSTCPVARIYHIFVQIRQHNTPIRVLTEAIVADSADVFRC